MIKESEYPDHPAINDWEYLIRVSTPGEDMIWALMNEYFKQEIPAHCSPQRYARIAAMTAIYINIYKRDEALPEFKDKPNDPDEVGFVEWLSTQYGVPVYLP